MAEMILPDKVEKSCAPWLKKNPETGNPELRVVMLGDSGCGKTRYFLHLANLQMPLPPDARLPEVAHPLRVSVPIALPGAIYPNEDRKKPEVIDFLLFDTSGAEDRMEETRKTLERANAVIYCLEEDPEFPDSMIKRIERLRDVWLRLALDAVKDPFFAQMVLGLNRYRNVRIFAYRAALALGVGEECSDILSRPQHAPEQFLRQVFLEHRKTQEERAFAERERRKRERGSCAIL